MNSENGNKPKGKPRGRTGPRTAEGKNISSRNAIKHGRFISPKTFLNLGEKAGTLMFCTPCGTEQQNACQAAAACAMHDQMILAYSKAAFENDLKPLMQVNTMQLATLDMIFSYKLRYAMENLGETQIVTGTKGEKVEVPMISEQQIYELINMMRSLGKTPMDMQITRQTQEAIDVEWAKLLDAEIDREKADENRKRILDMMTNWREARQEAQEMSAADKDIQEFMNSGQNVEEKPVALPAGKTLRGNPFAPIPKPEEK